jgi:hypothetical protein
MLRIADGDDFRKWLVAEVHTRRGVILEERIVEDKPLPGVTCTDQKPRVLCLDFGGANQLRLQIPPDFDDLLACEGLAVAYGSKQLLHDYSLPVFRGIAPERRALLADGTRKRRSW